MINNIQQSEQLASYFLTLSSLGGVHVGCNLVSGSRIIDQVEKSVIVPGWA